MVYLYKLYSCWKGLGRAICTNIEKCPLCKWRYVIVHCVECDSHLSKNNVSMNIKYSRIYAELSFSEVFGF